MKINIKIEPVKFREGKIILLDQRTIPEEEKYIEITNFRDVPVAIKDMIVRGAPAIGVTAAFGYVMGIKEGISEEEVFSILLNTRPTAVNLKNTLKIMRETWSKNNLLSREKLIEKLTEKAKEIFNTEREREFKMSEIGASLLPEKATVLTHCNTGALATTGWGTALGVIRTAHYSGREIFVWVDETRPRLQGARLTSWELSKEGIPHRIIADNAASFVMKNNRINAIIVGADRIAINGDTANKIGTYQLAISAKYHSVPFYVVAPLSTIDPGISNGSEIPIEFRDEREVKWVGNCRVAPEESRGYNPAFDVTPAELITGGIITEKGISKYPFTELKEWTGN